MEGYKLKRLKSSISRLDTVQKNLEIIVQDRIKPLRKMIGIKDRQERVDECRSYPFREGYNDDLSFVKGLVDTYNFNPAALVLIAEGFEMWACMLREEIAELEQYIKELVAGEHDEQLAEEYKASREES